VPGVDARNSNGDTPLMFAASSGHMGVVAALLNVSDCSSSSSRSGRI
jgi:ankyrin repeat protein